MEVEHTCPECGGNARMEDVKLCIWKAERLIVIEDINALVCDDCVEQYYDSLTRYKIDRLGENGFLKEEARKFLEKENALARNRNVLENESHIDEELWKKIVALGWTGIRIPEEYGGLGLGHLELCVIAEELGRFLAPVPFSSSVYLFTEALIIYGSDEIKKRLLPQLISGDAIGTIAVTEEFFAPSAENINVTCDDGKINGKKIKLILGDIKDQKLVSSLVSKEKIDLQNKYIEDIRKNKERIIEEKEHLVFDSERVVLSEQEKADKIKLEIKSLEPETSQKENVKSSSSL